MQDSRLIFHHKGDFDWFPGKGIEFLELHYIGKTPIKNKSLGRRWFLSYRGTEKIRLNQIGPWKSIPSIMQSDATIDGIYQNANFEHCFKERKSNQTQDMSDWSI